jgi:hypothetical protein
MRQERRKGLKANFLPMQGEAYLLDDNFFPKCSNYLLRVIETKSNRMAVQT